MKKLFRIISFCVILFLGIGIGYSAIRYYNRIALANEQLDDDFDPKELKEKTDIDIKPCKDIPAITKEQAIEIAIKNGGPKDRAKKIHAQYCLLSDPVMQIHPNDKIVQDNPLLKNKNNIEGIPVWIVSFRGIGDKEMLRHGRAVTENNFVIDATTGNLLYNFNFR